MTQENAFGKRPLSEAEIQSMERAFCRAMACMYAGGGIYTPVENKPGYKRALFQDGNLVVCDEYCTAEGSNFSSGTTTIWVEVDGEKIILWTMSYFGEYPDEFIPLLKQALMNCYKNERFYGGRGLRVEFADGGDLVYNNNVEDGSSFRRFSGTETIVSHSTRRRGFHRYFGGLFF